MKTKLNLRRCLLLACFLPLPSLALFIGGCKTENRTSIRLPPGATNASVTLKFDLVATNSVRVAPTGSISLRLDQEQPLRTTGKIEVVMATNAIRVIATNSVPLKLVAPDAPVNIQATNPFTLKIDTNGVIQARVTVSPVQVVVTNAVVNLTVPNSATGPTPSQTIVVSNILQPLFCCCTNENEKKGKPEDRTPEPPRFSNAGPSGWRWFLPLLCVLLAGCFARPLGRYIGVVAPLNAYDQQRQTIKEWLDRKWLDREMEPVGPGRPKEWFSLYRPLPDRKRDFQMLKKNLFMLYQGNLPLELLAQLRELEATVPLLATDARKDFFIGLTAAALCPVFLSFSSSNLVIASADNPFALAGFLGFCFLAAMLGAEFITAVFKAFRLLVILAEKKIAEGK